MQTKVKSLTGHSGCSLELLKSDDCFFVQKKSMAEKYNYRLKKQCRKQQLFKNTAIFAPQIYKSGIEDGLFYFDMEYVVGKTLAEYSSSIMITEIADLIRLLFKSLYMQNLEKIPRAQCIFENKISNLSSELKEEAQLREAFELLHHYNWKNIDKSPCHGDLTLENILISQNKDIYLIDFLDSFYNSWMLDIAKLLQDLDLKWSFRNSEPNPNRELRLLVAKEALIEEILEIPDGITYLKTIYHLLLLNVIRIYPYAKDEATKLFLDKSIMNLMDKLETKEIEGAVL